MALEVAELDREAHFVQGEQSGEAVSGSWLGGRPSWLLGNMRARSSTQSFSVPTLIESLGLVGAACWGVVT